MGIVQYGTGWESQVIVQCKGVMLVEGGAWLVICSVSTHFLCVICNNEEKHRGHRAGLLYTIIITCLWIKTERFDGLFSLE